MRKQNYYTFSQARCDDLQERDVFELWGGAKAFQRMVGQHRAKFIQRYADLTGY